MENHVCPVWIGYLLANPLRKIWQDPYKILPQYIKPNMNVLDIGCAMGFFTIPLAYLVGEKGKVICVDIQQKMLDKVEKKAIKKNVSDRVVLRLATNKSLNITSQKDQIDFAFAMAVVHEVSNKILFFKEVFEACRPKAKFMVAEPVGHVTKKEMAETVKLALEAGFTEHEKLSIRRTHAVLLKKPK